MQPTKHLSSIRHRPGCMVKEFADLLAQFITSFFNVSMTTGSFPQKYKNAVVKLLLKKINLEPSELKNVRPAPICLFLPHSLQEQFRYDCSLSSITRMHCQENKLHTDDGAALRRRCMVEVYNDLLVAVDGGEVSVLWLLDLTAAFDTVDHQPG
jgi:hypothetical protein